MLNKELMRIHKEQYDMPIRSAMIGRDEFLELSGTSDSRIDELLDMGWLKPDRTAESALLFRPADVYRLRKLERLCVDFELHTLAGTIIVDLLGKVQELEQQITQKQSS